MATYAAADLRTRRSGVGGSTPTGAWGNAPGADATSPWGGGGGGGWGNAGGGSGWSTPSTTASTASYTNGGSTGSSDTGKTSFRDMSNELKSTFALILITAVCLHADQNLAAPNLSAIAEDFQMTPLQKDFRLGGMVQFGFFLIGGAVSLLMGPATDQIDRITLLSSTVVSGALPSLLMSLFTPSAKSGFFFFFLARICTGIAIGGSFPVFFALTADLFPPSQRGMVCTCIGAATNIGAAVGGMMAGIIGPRFGWRVPFRVVAIPALVCAALVRMFLTDPRTKKRQQEAKEAMATVSNPAFAAWMGGEDTQAGGYVRMEDLDFGKFKTVLHVKTNLIIFAQALPGCMPISCIATFLSDYLAVEQGMNVQASTAVTAVFGISCLTFAVSGGLLGQKLFEKRKDLLPIVMGSMAACASIPFIVLVNSPQSAVTSPEGRPTMFAFLLALCGGCAAVTGPNIRSILMNVNDGQVRGTVFSAFTLFDDLGKGLGPSIIVAMTWIFGRRLAYSLAFLMWPVSGVILMGLRNTLAWDVSRSGGSLLPTKAN
eukprot:TRINITY_DN91543_c0_g1_i1.p1 TRINITY_DN91543_c0_g1~~TRINITY_DN91543_c0_g1_i1.p1  ORF type:complete len:544 (-),score=116.34 TRINITY_DN91543_c0_g1_i1:111-1742(-)